MARGISPEAILERKDDIDARYVAVRTVAGVLHIMDTRVQDMATRNTPGWRPRAMCGVSQASRGRNSGAIPLREDEDSVALGLAQGEKKWCRVCANGVRSALSAGGRKPTYETRAMAGASTKRIIVTGPINRSKHGGSSYPGFRQVSDHFRSTFVQVIDPSDMLKMFNANEPYSSHVRSHMDLFWEADALAAMEGWEGSNVATLLVMTARAIRMPILEVARNGEITASQYGKWQEWCAPLLSGPKERMLW